ncbi:MAG: RHS repeat protein [Chitinophagaceae bacterium]|nr:RHS repeat protein [Chitinophagaceae bacterium]
MNIEVFKISSQTTMWVAQRKPFLSLLMNVILWLLAADRTTYYEYDGFGRLSVVKDDAGKVLRKICYNYAGQEVNCNN